MTEQEWLECTDPELMLEFLMGKVSERKLRLFALASCRRTWDLLKDERSRKALEMGERYVDGVATRQDLRDAHAIVDAICALAADGHFDDVVEYFSLTAVCDATAEEPDFASSCCCNARKAIYRAAQDQCGLYEAECGHQCGFLRDIFTPFRPIAINSAWLTWNDGTIRKLAQSIYDDCAFDRLPILADALTDAGCHHADLLSHCRSDGPHVRGCWVVDLLLGKE